MQSPKTASFEAVFFLPVRINPAGLGEPSSNLVSATGEEFRSHFHPFLAMKSFVTLKKKEGQH